MSTEAGPARKALDLALARPAPEIGPRVIAIDGPSGAGKSTLAEEISRLSGAPVVHLDDLYDGWEGLESGVRLLVDRILEPLRRGTEGLAPRYDWTQSRYAGSLRVPAAPLVIVEGVGAGARACAPYVTVLVWMETPRDEGQERAVARDGEDLRDHLVRWQQQESRHHEAEGTRLRADITLRT